MPARAAARASAAERLTRPESTGAGAIMPAPMTSRPIPGCSRQGTGSLVVSTVLVLAIAACTTSSPPTPTTTPAVTQSAAPTPTPTPTASPTPTPVPTPRFTNEPDPELAALIPANAGGASVVRPPLEEYGLTPGDVAVAFGEIGDRFGSLVIAYVAQPRTTLYAMRVVGDPVETADLEPHLATAGRYVGISGLHREPWSSTTVDGHVVWVRPEDNATAAGTMIYTWAAGEFVFLLIGVDDAVNRALVAALPGEAPGSPTPVPSASGSASAEATATADD